MNERKTERESSHVHLPLARTFANIRERPQANGPEFAFPVDDILQIMTKHLLFLTLP